MSLPKAALIMGSDSDFEKLKGCISKLKEFKIEVDVNVISAHRTPDKAAEFAKNAVKNGIEVIICAAGMVRHMSLKRLTLNMPVSIRALEHRDTLPDTMVTVSA